MASSTTGLTATMQTFYDKKFLERAKIELRHDFGADTKNIPMNSGKTVYFTRFTPLAVVTTALSEATNPAETAMTAATVSAVLAEYGAVTNVGSLFSMTSIDTGLTEHISVQGQNAGESVDQLIRTVLAAGATQQLPAGVSTISSTSTIHTSDVLTGVEIRKAVRTLKLNKAQKFDNGYFRAITGPATAYSLFADSEWLDANRYTTSDAIKDGVIGKLAGVEFVETNNQKVTLSGGYSASTTDVANVYETFVFGKHAYAVVNLGSNAGSKVIVKNPGDGDTSNPLNMFSTIGWKVPFAAAVLNANWLISIKTGATGGNTATL